MGKTEMKKGLYRYGYVPEKDKVLVAFNELAERALDMAEFDEMAERASLSYVNSRGYDRFEEKPVGEDKAVLCCVKTECYTSKGEKILGWFQKGNKNTWKWAGWIAESEYKSFVSERTKFRLGHLVFDSWKSGEDFLDEIAKKALPEPWDFNDETKHSILRSYLENVYERLLHEADGCPSKIICSGDGNYILFNTNLLDKFSHDIYLVAERGDNGDACNPRYSKGAKERADMGFGRETPLPPQFFKDVNDIIFQPSWEVDKEYDAFNHIIEERRGRFSEKYSDMPTELLAKKLQEAIDFAVVLAQRNYKFIVPMYRPKSDSIQLLMPIYLDGIYNVKPDFALVLTLDSQHQMYIPETILTLDMCYNNARLIAKPDEAWLNPKTIVGKKADS
jgi:hypothetical protein